jgi:hypothetical protein
MAAGGDYAGEERHDGEEGDGGFHFFLLVCGCGCGKS